MPVSSLAHLCKLIARLSLPGWAARAMQVTAAQPPRAQSSKQELRSKDLQEDATFPGVPREETMCTETQR